MIRVMLMAHWLFQNKESDFKMCPILGVVCGFLGHQLIVWETALGFHVAPLPG